MLDKSIPYKNIIMKLDKCAIPAIKAPPLPEGYRFKLYEDGDEAHWANIETSVLEFDGVEAARDYFVKNYVCRLEELKRRCVFVINNEGLPVATATAWFADGEAGHRAVLHWVSVLPNCQGLGLGKAVVLKALSIFNELEPGEDVFLHTQTWSHVAVRLYHKIGFIMMKTANLKPGDNDFAQALEILRGLLPEDVHASLTDTAE